MKMHIVRSDILRGKQLRVHTTTIIITLQATLLNTLIELREYEYVSFLI